MFEGLKEEIQNSTILDSEVKEKVETIISAKDEVDSFLRSFSKNDKIYDSIFNSLVSVTDSFTEEMSNNLKQVISMEFLLVKLRVLISSDLNKCNSLISNQSTLSPSTLSALKRRVNYLVSLNTRLTDLREDYNSVQKLCYTANMKVF